MSIPARENHRYAVRMAKALDELVRHFFQELEDRTSTNEKAPVRARA